MKKKSAVKTLQQAKKRDFKKDTKIINNDLIHRKLQSIVVKKVLKAG